MDRGLAKASSGSHINGKKSCTGRGVNLAAWMHVRLVPWGAFFGVEEPEQIKGRAIARQAFPLERPRRLAVARSTGGERGEGKRPESGCPSS